MPPILGESKYVNVSYVLRDFPCNTVDGSDIRSAAVIL